MVEAVSTFICLELSTAHSGRYTRDTATNRRWLALVDGMAFGW